MYVVRYAGRETHTNERYAERSTSTNTYTCSDACVFSKVSEFSIHIYTWIPFSLDFPLHVGVISFWYLWKSPAMEFIHILGFFKSCALLLFLKWFPKLLSVNKIICQSSNFFFFSILNKHIDRKKWVKNGFLPISCNYFFIWTNIQICMHGFLLFLWSWISVSLSFFLYMWLAFYIALCEHVDR